MFYNYEVLKEDGPVFVVDGLEDVARIRAAGGKAVALEGAALSVLVAQIKKDMLYPEHLIIATANIYPQDLDKQTTILSAAGISYSAAINLFNNDDPERRAADLLKAAEAEIKERQEKETEEIRKESAGYHLDDFYKRRLEDAKAPDYKTGFKKLDKILDGGLHAGLYTVGAISSLGKTTFALQIVDNIAQAEQDVLVFSLEMARDELIAKAISRNTFIEGREENAAESALTTRQILNGKGYPGFSEKQRALLGLAIERYKKYAEHVFISEGVGNIGVEFIRQKVERHIKRTRKTPVILIDYLQILAADPEYRRSSDKQIVDKNILELKRISRDYKIPVIAVSSFNRQSYTDPVNLASFKESGAVEYSADVLLGLQFYGMDYKFDEKKNKWETQQDRETRIRGEIKKYELDGKEGRAQKLQLKVLKNRNGYRDECLLDFYPRYNYFEGV